MRIGIIGLGLMGHAMARRLVAAGHAVAGYDLRPDANEAARRLGVEVAAEAAPVAEDCDVLILSLLTSEDRRNLFWGRQSLADVLANGSLVLDTTTGRPDDIQADGARLAERGIRLVDVCVSGSSQVVNDGRAIALIGDTRENAAAYASALTAFTKEQHYFGALGRGCCAKLIVNTVFGLHRLVLAEALSLARAGGFDLGEILEVLKQGETYSVAMDTKGPKMISGNYAPAVARLDQHAKDVSLILEYAAHIGAEVPLSALHKDLLARAQEKGGGPLDNAAIFKAYDPE